MRLSVSADVSDNIDLFGKTASELQENITVRKESITGTLFPIEDYTGFSSDPSLTSGHYLAIRAFVPDEDDVTITVTVTKSVVLDEDGIVVLRIADKSSQTVTVVASKEGYRDVTRVFALNALECPEE